jgi:hypothetical protein
VNTISIAPKHCVASEEESGSGIIWRKSCCFKLLAFHHEVFSLVLKGLIYARRYIATAPFQNMEISRLIGASRSKYCYIPPRSESAIIA